MKNQPSIAQPSDEQKKGIDILIIEDHQIVLLGLTTLLSTYSDIRSIDKATTGREALRLVSGHAFDVLIIDVELPDMSGFELLSQVREVSPDVAVIFHSMHEESWIIRQMMNCGANAIVLKSDDLSELHKALAHVVEGESYYSSRYEEFCKKYEQHQMPTERELDVLRAIAEGKRTAEIAEALFVSPNTVEFHRKRLLQKFGASNMAELIKTAIGRGLIKT